MNSFSAVHVNCTRLIMPNSPRGIQCSFIILCDETLQMTWLPEDKSGVLNFMLLIIFVLGMSAFWKRQCQPWRFGCKLATSWFWQFVCFALHLCEHPLSCAPHLCRHFCRIYFNMGKCVCYVCLGTCFSLSLSQLAAFSSDWLLKERALQGNEHGTDRRDKKVLITQRSAENGIWAPHAPSSSVTPGQMLTLWPFVMLQNQPRVSHKQKIWVSYVPWEKKQQKKKKQHFLLISYKLVHSSEQKSKDQKLTPTSGNLSFLWTKCKCLWAVHTFHIWNVMSFSVEHTWTMIKPVVRIRHAYSVFLQTWPDVTKSSGCWKEKNKKERCLIVFALPHTGNM